MWMWEFSGHGFVQQSRVRSKHSSEQSVGRLYFFTETTETEKTDDIIETPATFFEWKKMYGLQNLRYKIWLAHG